MTNGSWPIGGLTGEGLFHSVLPHGPPLHCGGGPWAALAAHLSAWSLIPEQICGTMPPQFSQTCLSEDRLPLLREGGQKGPLLCLSCSGLGKVSLLVTLDSCPNEAMYLGSLVSCGKATGHRESSSLVHHLTPARNTDCILCYYRQLRRYALERGDSLPGLNFSIYGYTNTKIGSYYHFVVCFFHFYCITNMFQC